MSGRVPQEDNIGINAIKIIEAIFFMRLTLVLGIRTLLMLCASRIFCASQAIFMGKIARLSLFLILRIT